MSHFNTVTHLEDTTRTEQFECARECEFSYLSSADARQTIYLDAAGAALPLKSQLQSVFSELQSNLLGNPHSYVAKSHFGDISGKSVEDIIEDTRKLVLQHFGTNEMIYDCVFTSGATAGLKIIGDCFPWSENSAFCYPMNAHTSLLSIRELAPKAFSYSSQALLSAVHEPHAHTQDTGSKDDKVHGYEGYSLLGVAGECNFTGSRADLSAVVDMLDRAKSRDPIEALHAHCVDGGRGSQSQTPSGRRQKWLWVLDAAKLASSSTIHLNDIAPPELRPHFVVVSFYKIFGYPTGLGALLVRRDAARLLRKK